MQVKLSRLALLLVSLIAFDGFLISSAFAQSNKAKQMRSQIEREIEGAVMSASGIVGNPYNEGIRPATSPEKEMERQRNLINRGYKDFMRLKGEATMTAGGEGYQGSSPRRGDGLDGSISEDGIRSTVEGKEDGADKKSKNKDDPSSSIHSTRDLPEPPRAIAIEGRILIEGSAADAKAPRDANAGVKYAIEEKFVGNLIIATAEEEEKDDLEKALSKGKLSVDAIGSTRGTGKVEGATSASKNAGGILGKDYQIHSASKQVKVNYVGGGACIMSTGKKSDDCLEKDPFVKSDISPENKFGNFHDGVISAESTGGHIQLKVSTPEVSFSTLRGTTKAKASCSEAVFTIKKAEFKEMVERGNMTVSKQFDDGGVHSSSCRRGSTITLHISFKGK